MKADALAQYLVWKRWPRWFLVLGSHPEDQKLAEAYRRAAERFGAEIVDERVYEDTGGARRTDTGHVQIQSQMPVFTQDAGDYDVLVAADEADVFAEYLPYRTWDARPVAGSVGLDAGRLEPGARAVGRHPGAAPVREVRRPADDRARLRRLAGGAHDRRGGDPLARTPIPPALHDYMVGDEFEIAAFKGQGLTFRRWDQQMRQPILLVTPRMLVSVSPQDQFLHQRTPLGHAGLRRAREPLPPQLSERPTMHRSLTLALSGTLAFAGGLEAREIYVSNEKGNSITVIDGDKLEVTATDPGRQPAARHHPEPGRQASLHLRLGRRHDRDHGHRHPPDHRQAAVRPRSRADGPRRPTAR